MNGKPRILQTLRMIIVLLYMIVLLPLLSIVSIFLFAVSFGKLRNFLVRWIGYAFGRSILTMAGVRLQFRYHGEKPNQPAVYMYNHCSTLDMFIVVSLLLPPSRYIAKREFQFNPFFWLLNKILGNILIDRKKSRAAAEKLYKAYKQLRENRVSIVFAPEGTRSLDGQIGSFKSGAFRTAIELGYPIIPIYIEGAYELCPGKSLVTQPGVVTIHFHPPIDTTGWDSQKIRAHVNEVRKLYLNWSDRK